MSFLDNSRDARVEVEAEEHKAKYPTFDLKRFLTWFEGLPAHRKGIVATQIMSARVKTMRFELSVERTNKDTTPKVQAKIEAKGIQVGDKVRYTKSSTVEVLAIKQANYLPRYLVEWEDGRKRWAGPSKISKLTNIVEVEPPQVHRIFQPKGEL